MATRRNVSFEGNGSTISLRNPIESIEKDTMDAFHATGADVPADGAAAVSTGDSASALAQAEAAEPTFHKVAPYVTIGGGPSTESLASADEQTTSLVVKPYRTIIASTPTQLEIDGVSATAATSTPGSKT